MDWEDLRHFLALAAAGSLSQAAREMKVDHTTIARRVAALESALGLTLIERRPRGVALTAAGRRIASLGGAMDDAAQAIRRAAADDRDEVAGTVRISAPPLLCSHYLAARMAPLRARHPRLTVELVGENRFASLTRRDADIALRLAGAQARDGALVQRKLGELAFALYGAPDMLAHTPPAAWSFIAFADEFGHLPQQNWLNSIIAGRPVALRAHELASQIAAAAAGMGVACLPCFLADADPRLARAQDPRPKSAARPPNREIWLLVHEDLRHAPRVRATMDAVVDIFSRDAALLAARPETAAPPIPPL